MAPDEHGVTMRLLMAAPGLDLVLVTGPDEPDRVLRWAHCTELLDPARYLRGGELVLTVGSALTSEAACDTYVRVLVSCGARALGLGVGDVHREVPPGLRVACERYGLPLLSVPHGVPFQLLTEMLAEHRVTERLVARAEHDLGRLLQLVVDGLVDPRSVVDQLGLDGQSQVVATAWPASQVARVRTLLADSALGTVGPAVVALVATSDQAAALAAAHGIACGTGERVAVLDLARSVRGALAALEVSAARGRPVASAELATLDALLDRLPEAGLRPFLDQLIAPLTEHDLRTGSDLVASLRAFVGSGGAMVPTARSLFLHPNTLRHRMRRVTDLTGRDPLDWRDRICFTVALGAQDRRCAPRER